MQIMQKSKISSKFIKIVLFISLFVLTVSSIVAFYIMGNIESSTQNMIKKNIDIKLQNKINNSFKIGATNAVAISQNNEIKDALKKMDKEKAYDILNNLEKQYIKLANYKKTKIHIHTHDVKSFLRSWVKDHNGDELSSFRHTINKVKATKQTVLDIEVGWADLVIRAIVPIMDDKKYLGSLEFIQDFSSIQKQLEKENKYLFSLIDLKLLKNQPKSDNIIGNYGVVQKDFNGDFFKILKTIDLNELISKSYIHKDEKYFSLKPIIGFNNSFIGYYVIAQDYNEIQKILTESLNITYSFMILMVFMAFVIGIAIHFIVQKLIVNNLTNVTEGLSSFFKFLNKETTTITPIDINTHDEIGQMATEINANINVIKDLINQEYQENWLKDALRGLNENITGTIDLKKVSKESIGYLCEYIKSAVGVIYIYDNEKEELELYGSYAYKRSDNMPTSFKLGEGTIGQVALQKSAIDMKNTKNQDILITSGTAIYTPSNTYAFPLIYQNNIYGVIEISSTRFFEEMEYRLFELTAPVIATALFSTIQTKKVKNLLKESETSNTELHKQQAQLEEANSQMQEQQAQLEEANSQMEEQQVQLKQSEVELKEQNKELEISKVELNKKAEDLEESNRYKSEFLANMSHELRTPLNSVILLSSMLKENKKDNLTADDIKKAHIINSSGEELLRLINDVLDLSKVEAGRMELLIEEFPSSQFAQQIEDQFESSMSNKNLEFIVEDKYNNIITSDENKLSQIVRNFLSNALKFTHEGFVKFTIEPSGDDVKLSVTDSGIGIAQDKQDLVFLAFAQADGSTSRKYGGTGLGLSITKELVGLMNGKLNLESQEGKGSSFSIVIPNFTNGNDNLKVIDNIIESSKPIIKVKSRNDIDIKDSEDDRDKITDTDKPFLIIEDNVSFSNILKSVINEKGDLALVSHGGKKGLELAKKYNNIQGILLDLGLPDIDGIDVLKELKNNVITKKIPVYIVSGRDSYDSSSFMGAVGFKQKPLSNDDLNSVFADFDNFNGKEIKDLLVVEDDDIQREAMIDFISNDFINIVGVGDIKSAIEEIKNRSYDAIIVDLTLNGKSGLQICDYIRDHKLTIPIIIYTGKELSQIEEVKIKKYTDSIIVKSSNSQNRLLEEVDRFLHRVKNQEIVHKKPNLATDDIDFTGKKILVVDDDMRNTFVLVEILEARGAEVLTAMNGQESLDILDENSDISIVLMDIMMPVMDGFEAIEKIRDDEKLKDIPVIAITAKAMDQDKQKCYEVGANDFLTKPLNLNTFVGVVSSWIK